MSEIDINFVNRKLADCGNKLDVLRWDFQKNLYPIIKDKAKELISNGDSEFIEKLCRDLNHQFNLFFHRNEVEPCIDVIYCPARKQLVMLGKNIISEIFFDTLIQTLELPGMIKTKSAQL